MDQSMDGVVKIEVLQSLCLLALCEVKSTSSEQRPSLAHTNWSSRGPACSGLDGHRIRLPT